MARFIFVHIQKTGGESIRAALGLPRYEPRKHRSARELRELYTPEEWASALKFAIVRNPWDRLVSWWSFINSRRGLYFSGYPVNKFVRYVLSNAATFQELIERCDAEIHDEDGAKWIFRNQLDYITDENGQQIVDFVGRFERLLLHAGSRR